MTQTQLEPTPTYGEQMVPGRPTVFDRRTRIHFGGHTVPVADPSRDAPIAVLLPCRNEEASIADVVCNFRAVLPSAKIYVYDNASSDRTAMKATAAGAIVRYVREPGKGNVIRRMFSEIDAAVYVLADGDDTYDAAAAPRLIHRLLSDQLDMVIGTRVEAGGGNAYRPGHRLGNRLLSRSVQMLFDGGSDDMLSGYRVFSRRYVKSFPAASRGFETETEMTVHALDLALPFAEVPTAYTDRRPGSSSKLQTIPDGWRILKFVIALWKDYQPLRFFSAVALLCACLALGSWFAAAPLHRPAILGFATVGFAATMLASLFAGVIVDSVGRSRREIKRMLYLAIPQSTS